MFSAPNSFETARFFQPVLDSSVGGRLAGGGLGRRAGLLAAQHSIMDGGIEHGRCHVLGEELQAVEFRQHAPCKIQGKNQSWLAKHQNSSLDGGDQKWVGLLLFG